MPTRASSSLLEPIAVRDLPPEGLRFEETLDRQLLSQLAPEVGKAHFSIEADGMVSASVIPISDSVPPTVRVMVSVTVTLSSACVRCLTGVSVDLEAELDSALRPSELTRSTRHVPEASDGLEAWDDGFPEPGSLDDDVYDGTSVPLCDLIRQSILVELPTDPVCLNKIDCDRRTQALLHEANLDYESDRAQGDPRWAALRSVKAQMTEALDARPGPSPPKEEE